MSRKGLLPSFHFFRRQALEKFGPNRDLPLPGAGFTVPALLLDRYQTCHGLLPPDYYDLLTLAGLLDQTRKIGFGLVDSDGFHIRILAKHTRGRGMPQVARNPYPFALIICSACLREVSVSLAPLNMRATSSVRSSPTTARMLVRVRPPHAFFSMT